MKKVVILGAGFAGLHIFYKLRDLIGKEIDLSIVEQNSYSLLKPSLPEVAFDNLDISHVQIPIKDSIEKRGANFIQDRVIKIDPNKKIVFLKDKGSLEYDTLFITLGANKDYSAIEGYKDYGYSICDDIESKRLNKKLQNFKGGKIVTGSAKSEFGNKVNAPKLSAPCEGPIGEVMFMSYYFLKEKGIKNFSIDVFSPAKEFFEDVGKKPHEVVGALMQERGIKLHTSKVLKKIAKDYIEFEDGTKLQSDLTIIIPPYKAPKAIINSNIGDEKGFIVTNSKMQHLKYKDIYCAGDLNALTQPKLGHIAILQAAIAAAAFKKEFKSDIKIPAFEPNIFCIMNMGGFDAIMINDNTLYGGNISVAIHSPLAKAMKWGFDNYLYFNKGHMPPDFALELTDKLTKIL